jgi:hypothetical protein
MAELRQIRTLRLGAARREQVARTAIALEDALRTASLPLPRGAILLVRRLDLGQIPADASPQWLSRQIETRLLGLPLAAADPPHAAPAAPAVWFADRCAALAALLAASLDEAPRAWYWAGVLPGWHPGMTVRELLPRALRRAEVEPTGSAGVAALLDRLLRLDRLDAMLEHLAEAHLAPLANSSRATKRQTAAAAPQAAKPFETADVAMRPPGPTEAPVPLIAHDRWRAVLSRWLRQWGAADRRSQWLAAHALIAVHGPAAAARAGRLIAWFTTPTSSSRNGASEAQAERRGPASPRSTPGMPVVLNRKDVWPAVHEDLGAAPAEDLPSTAPDWQSSRHGGLLLLLPALARLAIAEADRDGDLCLRLLHRLADRLKIPRDDAIRAALPQPLPPEGRPAFVPPQAWRGLLRLPPGVDLGREDGLLAACQLALARYLRRFARISPRRLVRRPALVHATRTHIDLRFDARWVELEVRLAGLDLDPGWVPWLGRVVSFHYDYGGRR